MLDQSELTIDSAEVVRDNGVTNVEDVFPVTFYVLKVIGFWMPTNIKLDSGRLLYLAYGSICFVSITVLLTSIIAETIISEKSTLISLIENWFIMVIFVIGLMKVINLLMRRPSVIGIMKNNMMEERWVVLRSKEETTILKQSRNSEKVVTLVWVAMLVVNHISGVLSPIARGSANRTLVFESYTLCDRSLPFCYWICYAHQCFGYAIFSMTHAGCDCLIFNCVERICAHLRMFEQRLLHLPEIVDLEVRDERITLIHEKLYFKRCVEDYLSILQSVKNLNRTFYEVVQLQFFLYISILCTNIYFLSKQDLFSPDFIAVFFYLCCALAQNFFYCWYGYKISEKVSDITHTIFNNMDWTILQNETKKMLMFLMLAMSNGITLFNNNVVNLNPETFLKMIKLSYSAFNLLQQSYKK